VPGILTPLRRRGVEILDLPDTDPEVVTRSLRDVARANALFGGLSSAIDELKDALADLPRCATLLDVGTGLGDIPCRAKKLAQQHKVEMTTVGLDSVFELARASTQAVSFAVCGNALSLPFADRSVDVVMCSQVLHHFAGTDAVTLLREMNRVARVRVVVSDLRRSWIAVAGLWLFSFPLRFHAVSRHDGVVSVLRGFTPGELVDTVNDAVAQKPVVHRRRGFRITTSWAPACQ
jgi:SAM-dependent methyltransferase